ncbi:MAG: conjugative transposon protein TraM [Bacteroidales bacterium]|nr:conjugative transposon protein TraM [Bacteroidales bacterium]
MTGNHQRTDGNKGLISDEQKQKMKKYAVFALMGVICAGCLFFIFSPSADDKARREQSSGFNTDIPMPSNEAIIGDKRDAYEQEQVKRRQQERMRSLHDFADLLGDNTPVQSGDLSLLPPEDPVWETTGGYNPRPPSSPRNTAITGSAAAYSDINRVLENFYETPREDPEKERLKQELEEMKMRMEEEDARKNSVDNHLELMEKSFQMAARYMPGAAGTFGTAEAAEMAAPVVESAAGRTGSNMPSDMTATPVSQVREQTVSALLPQMSDKEFIAGYGNERNRGFITATEGATDRVKNTVLACVHADQTVTEGQSVRLRLLEPMQVANMVIPANTVLSGAVKLQGERMGITVSLIEHTGVIIPVDLRVYDMDGQNGIFIPSLQELSAAKEIIANMGTSAGTSISLSSDAGQQFVADMGRNVIQGVSQFAAKKLREVKVHLKAGHRLYLLTETGLK